MPIGHRRVLLASAHETDALAADGLGDEPAAA